jgi:hypothetical protein
MEVLIFIVLFIIRVVSYALSSLVALHRYCLECRSFEAVHGGVELSWVAVSRVLEIPRV